MSKKSYVTISIVFVLILSIFIYALMMQFAEERQYNQNSLDYLILTPEEIIGIKELCQTEPQFRYSSADGPKPMMTQLECHLDTKTLLPYLSQKQYVGDSHHRTYRKGTSEIVLSDVRDGAVQSLMFLEYTP
ncbi:hypothetical protein VR7878_01654 [Vibrio ruber DSM 16370]|uniref:Uncharacterized protein n=1 Tax=Vibrio ruber (strain DSM 16370 / JCM 11486 / BCRC 17186 / CECT 7878 / LMG 23124 / VR1) TaxID=1123498 RepID=A0A1R4LI64_VIBR1|nr:hypothetical protein [Vibrio ruber]SJN56208.1 hypothetical protein VR7878_01654 [Vibrio ruber DSM 16370]